MKLTFEIINTTSKPIYIFVDNDFTLQQMHNVIKEEIETYTILTKDAVLDIFVENNISSKTLSIPNIHQETIQTFIDNNSMFFPLMSGIIYNNVYKIYIMDKIYLHRQKNNQLAPIYQDPPVEIQTNNLQLFIENTKKMIYLF